MSWFPENGGATISKIKSISSPEPEDYATDEHNESANWPFAEAIAYTGYVEKVDATEFSKESVDASGNSVSHSRQYEKWTVSYDPTTGFPQTKTVKQWDTSTDQQVPNTNTTIYTYTAYPDNPYQNYYMSYKKVTDASGNVTQAITYNRSYANILFYDNYTATCYSDDRVTRAANCDITYNGNQASKKVQSVSWSADGTTATITNNFYNTDDKEVYRKTEVIEVANAPLCQASRITVTEYGVNPNTGNTTWATKYTFEYENGFQTVFTSYSAENTVSFTETFTRDAQGREIGYVKKDASGDTTYEKEYTTDSVGRIIRMIANNYTNGTRDSTPDEKWEDEWGTDSDGNKTKTHTKYGNQGSYQTDPSYRYVYTYNALGRQIKYERYQYNSSTGEFELDDKSEYEYDSNGIQTKTQHYSVSNGTATPWYEYRYEHDDNYFHVISKGYDASGDLSSQPWDTNHKCTENSHCYSVMSG